MAHDFQTNDFKLWNDAINGVVVNSDEAINQDLKEIIESTQS